MKKINWLELVLVFIGIYIVGSMVHEGFHYIDGKSNVMDFKIEEICFFGYIEDEDIVGGATGWLSFSGGDDPNDWMRREIPAYAFETLTFFLLGLFYIDSKDWFSKKEGG